MSKINISELVAKFKGQSYRDFEGLADGRKVLAMFKTEGKYTWDTLVESREGNGDEVREAVRSIVLNIAYEYLDQFDTEVTPLMADILTYAVSEVLTVSGWSRVTDQMVKDLETAEPEEEEGD